MTHIRLVAYTDVCLSASLSSECVHAFSGSVFLCFFQAVEIELLPHRSGYRTNYNKVKSPFVQFYFLCKHRSPALRAEKVM